MYFEIPDPYGAWESLLDSIYDRIRKKENKEDTKITSKEVAEELNMIIQRYMDQDH